MTQEELLRIKGAMDKAQEDTTPYLVIKDEENMAVVGDPNKTEVHKNDYVIVFTMPTENGYEDHEIEFKDVFVKPRQNTRILTILTKMMPYFYKILPDKSIGEYTDQEAREIVSSLDDEIYDLMYKTVGSTLEIDKSLWDYMRLESVMGAFLQIITNAPNLFNEAQSSFHGDSSVGGTRS